MSAGCGASAVELPPRLRRAIERGERPRLGHATAVLNCLMVAAMYDESIDASAVAKVACSLVSKAIDRLDSVELLRAVEGRSAEIPP
jgi:hypothetical protein